MKKLITIQIFLSVFFLLGAMQAEAKLLNNDSAPCQIKEVEVTNEVQNYQRAWSLTYGSENLPVFIFKCTDNSCTSYFVRSEFFEVHYASDKKGFGTRKLKNSMATVPFSITNAVINQDKLKVQEIISPNQVEDEKAVELIASYLPELINENYTHLLN